MPTVSEQLQAIIDALPNLGNAPTGLAPTGGIAWMPYGKFQLDAPLRLQNGVRLKSQSGNTILEGQGCPAVLFNNTKADNHYIAYQGVEDCFLSSTGPTAVAIAGGMSEASTFHIRDCFISGDVDWVNPSGMTAYQAQIRDTFFVDRGQIRFKGDMLDLDRVKMNYRSDRPLLIADSAGSIEKCWPEGPGQMIVLRNGGWSWRSNHSEMHAGGPQIVLDRAVLEADHLYFVSPLNPVHLTNGSRVMVTRTLEAKLPAPSGAVCDPALCYLTDNTTVQRLDAANKPMWKTVNGAKVPQMINANSVWFNGAEVRVGKIAA